MNASPSSFSDDSRPRVYEVTNIDVQTYITLQSGLYYTVAKYYDIHGKNENDSFCSSLHISAYYFKLDCLD